MYTYLVTFKDAPAIRVKAWDRSRAITAAVRERRGRQPATTFRQTVTSAKKIQP